MRTVFNCLIAILFYSCNNINSLNDQLYEAQKQAVINSPCGGAKGTMVYVEAQKKFRSDKLPELIKNKIFPQGDINDTILLIESFDAVCINCPSDWIQIFYKDTVYNLKREITERNKISLKTEIEPYNIASTDFNYRLRNNELIEVLSKIRNKESWISNPLQYGSDFCNDGSHTFISIIYPNKAIESMYVRCWMPFLYRNRK